MAAGEDKVVAKHFVEIEKEIIKKINEKRGLFLGFCHRDGNFNEYLTGAFLKFLQENKIVVFAEIDEKPFQAYVKAVNSAKKQLNFDILLEYVTDMAKRVECEEYVSIEFIALLLTLYCADIKIFPYEPVPGSDAEKKQNEKVNDILFRGKGATPENLRWAMAERASKDEKMAAKIKSDLSKMNPQQKFIIMGGSEHVKISTILGLDALSIRTSDFYKNILLCAPGSVLQNLKLSNVVSYVYDETSIKKVTLAEAYKKHGNELFDAKKYQESIVYYESAIELNPNFKEAWLNKAKALRLLGRKSDALISANKAKDIDSNYKGAVSFVRTIKQEIKAEEDRVVAKQLASPSFS